MVIIATNRLLFIPLYSQLSNSSINIIKSRHEDENQGRTRERSTWNRLLLQLMEQLIAPLTYFFEIL